MAKRGLDNRFRREGVAPRSSVAPFKMGLSLVYNDFPWITRPEEGNNRYQIIPTTPWREHHKTDLSTLVRALESLKEMGIIEEVDWRGHYFTVRIKVPHVV